VRTLLAHRDFRLLFWGQSASTLGDRIVTVALALYVTQVGSPTDVGIVLAAHTLPLVAFLLLGGVWADRMPRQQLMLLTDFARGGLHALLAVLILAGTAPIWLIVVIEALFGSAEAFFRPAYTGVIPQTVPDELLQEAKAATGMVETLAQFLGPAVATALVFGVGAGWAFAADAATFAVSAFFVVRMRPRARGDAPRPASLAEDFREGFDAVRSRRWVWVTISVFSLALLCSFAPWQTLGATVSRDQYGDAALYGVMVAAEGAGTVLGALVGFRWRPLHPMRTGFVVVLGMPVSVAAFAAGAPALVCAVVFLAAGAGVALFIVWWETALAERIPPHLLGRVTSYDWMGSLALMPIGFLAAGPLGESLGSTRVLLWGSLIALAAIASGLLVRETRELRRLERAPGVLSQAP
jgi:MFS family permease